MRDPAACQLILAAQPGERLFGEVLPWLLALAAIVVIGAVAILLIRRLLRPGDEQDPIGFSLKDLREMHRAGEISDAEYERAREAMIGRVRRGTEKQAAEAQKLRQAAQAKPLRDSSAESSDTDASETSRSEAGPDTDNEANPDDSSDSTDDQPRNRNSGA